MITDERPHVRKLALRRKQSRKSVRPFKLPKFNFNAKAYIDIIDWSNTTMTEPLITAAVTDSELEDFFNDQEHQLSIFLFFHMSQPSSGEKC